eukprot:g60426.t1
MQTTISSASLLRGSVLRKRCLWVISLPADVHPPTLGWLRSWFPELNTSLVYAVEQHFLHAYNASFAENFYGLKRVVLLDGKEVPLREVDRRRALFFLVAVPYIREKLESTYEADLERQRDNLPPQSAGHAFLLSVYPYFHLVYEALQFGFQLAYLLGTADAFSPWLYLCSQRIKRITMNDVLRHQQRQQQKLSKQELLSRVWQEHERKSGFLPGLWRVLARLRDMAARNAKWALLIFLLAFKFAEWWYSPANVLGTRRKLPIPPPPPPSEASPPKLAMPASNRICPLCRRHRTNPAAVPTGFVFCYPCIHAYVSENGFCPVTRLLCTIHQIRRVYTD